MRVKVRTAAATKIIQTDETVSVVEFVKLLENDSDLVSDGDKISVIKNAFPPKPINMNLERIGEEIHNGDQLIVETTERESGGKSEFIGTGTNTEKTGTGNSTENTGTETGTQKHQIPHVTVHNQYLILRNIPDDNSCMFNAINYALKQDTVAEMRQICASYIASDPDKYCEPVLGRTNDAYCQWITKKDSWGGAIELGILSSYYQIQINCLDIELGNFINFKDDDQQVSKFINLVYSGIHYDILCTNTILSSEKNQNDQCLWDMKDSHIMAASHELCQLLQTKNYTTNTTKFRIRCLDCYSILVGETGAARHANDTGHYRFGEVKDA